MMSILTGILVVLLVGVFAERGANYFSVFSDDETPVELVDDEIAVRNAGRYFIDVLANDHGLREGDAERMELTSAPRCGEAWLDLGGVVYTPGQECDGLHVLTYCVERDGRCRDATVRMNVSRRIAKAGRLRGPVALLSEARAVGGPEAVAIAQTRPYAAPEPSRPVETAEVDEPARASTEASPSADEAEEAPVLVAAAPAAALTDAAPEPGFADLALRHGKASAAPARVDAARLPQTGFAAPIPPRVDAPGALLRVAGVISRPAATGAEDAAPRIDALDAAASRRLVSPQAEPLASRRDRPAQADAPDAAPEGAPEFRVATMAGEMAPLRVGASEAGIAARGLVSPAPPATGRRPAAAPEVAAFAPPDRAARRDRTRAAVEAPRQAPLHLAALDPAPAAPAADAWRPASLSGALASPAAPSLTDALFAARPADEAPPAAAAAAPAPFDCATRIEARPLPGALIELAVKAPCRAGEAFAARHAGLAFAGRVDEAGAARLLVPAFERRAVVEIGFADGAASRAHVVAREFRKVNRVALLWGSPIDLNLHAREFGAAQGEEGHVWAGAPGGLEQYRRGERGLLQVFEPLDGLGDRVEVYSHAPGRGGRAGSIRLGVEFASRGAVAAPPHCGRHAAASPTFRVMRLERGRAVRRPLRAISAAECGAEIGADDLLLSDIVADVLVVRR